MTFLNPLGGGHKFELPRLMHRINRDVHFLLTKAVTNNRLARSIYGGGYNSGLAQQKAHSAR
jgi:hypothetical protein